MADTVRVQVAVQYRTVPGRRLMSTWVQQEQAP